MIDKYAEMVYSKTIKRNNEFKNQKKEVESNVRLVFIPILKISERVDRIDVTEGDDTYEMQRSIETISKNRNRRYGPTKT